MFSLSVQTHWSLLQRRMDLRLGMRGLVGDAADAATCSGWISTRVTSTPERVAAVSDVKSSGAVSAVSGDSVEICGAVRGASGDERVSTATARHFNPTSAPGLLSQCAPPRPRCARPPARARPEPPAGPTKPVRKVPEVGETRPTASELALCSREGQPERLARGRRASWSDLSWSMRARSVQEAKDGQGPKSRRSRVTRISGACGRR